MAELLREQFVEQKITQQVTITNGTSDTVSVTIPSNCKAFLKGYGYTWFTTNTYVLSAGKYNLPSRTDQEGSPSIPVIYGNPFPVNSGERISLQITNGDSASHTYDVVFYIITNRIIPTNSTGGELTITTGSGASSGNDVAIWDSTFTTNAGVTAFGLAVDPTPPSTLRDGTGSAVAAAAAIGSSTALKRGVLIQCDPSATNGILVGNATSQSFALDPGDAMFIEIANLATVYVKRNGSSNATFNYSAA